MVEMDSWCPSCGYSVEPGTRFCGGCGYQFGPAGDASSTGSSTVAMQAPEPFQGYPPPPPQQVRAGFQAPAPPLSAPPPPSGSPLPWPPPPVAGSQAPSGFAPPPTTVQPVVQPTTVQPPISDTMDRMLRPQGLFQNAQQVPASWQQPYPAAPAGQPPQGAPYPPGGQYPPGPQAWGPAPTGGIPVAPAGGIPALPPGGQSAPGAGGGYPGYGNAQYAGPQYGNGQYAQDPYGNGQYAQDPYGNGQYAQDPYGNGQYGQVPYGQEQFPPGAFGPGVQYGPDGMPLGGDAQPGPRSKLPFKRPKGKMVPVTVGGGLVVIVIAALALAMHGGSSPGSSGASAAGTPTASAAGTSALTQQQAATALSGLLAQSGNDHSDVNAAVSNVEACGTGLSHDAQVLSTAAGNRRTLLTKLAQLPGHSALSPAMIADLTAAWQASATVDADLSKWAADAAGHCRKGNLNDPHYTATIPFDSKATNGKIAFVKLWNPLAKKVGLPSYQAEQL